jgi:hypothetical protein
MTGTCTDAAGNTDRATKTFAYDETAPSVTVTPTRAPVITDEVGNVTTTARDEARYEISCGSPLRRT